MIDDGISADETGESVPFDGLAKVGEQLVAVHQCLAWRFVDDIVHCHDWLPEGIPSGKLTTNILVAMENGPNRNRWFTY